MSTDATHPTILTMGGVVVSTTSVAVVRSRFGTVVVGIRVHLPPWRPYSGKQATQDSALSTEQLLPVAPSPNSQLQSFSRPHSASDVAVAALSSILPLELQFVRGRHLPLRSQCESSQAPQYTALWAGHSMPRAPTPFAVQVHCLSPPHSASAVLVPVSLKRRPSASQLRCRVHFVFVRKKLKRQDMH